MSGERHRVPVTVLGGYLGAGKTTILVAALTATHGQRIAVIVNDFGELHIDAALIADRSAARIDLANGCACCQVGDNLAEAFFSLAEQSPPWDRIVVEASGVADPARVAGWASLPGLRLDGIVVAADATSIATQVTDRYVGDLVGHQLSTADLIVLTKCDLASDAEREGAVATVRTHARAVPLVESTGMPPVEALFGLEVGGPLLSATDHGTRFTTVSWCPEGTIDADALCRVLAGIEGLVRAKGFVRSSGGISLVQAVGRRVVCTAHPGREPEGVVLIGVRELFDPATALGQLTGLGTVGP